jgi:hypothetical protein
MLDQQLGDVNVKLVTTRRRMGGINSAKEQNVAIQKQIKILENRMEKAYIKFNEAITHNKQLREQIDNMRRERMMFENIDNSLERELIRLKKEMADIIEQSTVAHETRERALVEMAHLKQQADREQQGFEDEWKALTSIIEEDRKARVGSAPSCQPSCEVHACSRCVGYAAASDQRTNVRNAKHTIRASHPCQPHAPLSADLDCSCVHANGTYRAVATGGVQHGMCAWSHGPGARGGPSAADSSIPLADA